MKADELLCEIRDNLKDYPIEILKKRAEDDRYPDNIYKRLAQYNSKTYDEIFTDLNLDFDIKDSQIQNLKDDIDYYFSVNDPGDIENREFTKYISLFLVFISKKPLHPVGDNPLKDTVYEKNNIYYCRDKIKYINDKNSLCRYCISQKVLMPFGF